MRLMFMHLVNENVGELGEALGLDQFLQQHSCSHVDEPGMFSGHLLQSNLEHKYAELHSEIKTATHMLLFWK